MLQKFKAYYIPWILFLIDLLSKWFFINDRDICLDEPFTLFHAQSGFWEILKLPTQNEPNPPLFMVLLHFWMKLFGLSANAIRVLPLLFNALTVVYLYKIGEKISSTKIGVFSALIFILSTYHFYFALETRTYSLLVLATATSLYYFISILSSDSKRMVIGLIVSNLLLVYSHYFGIFVLFVQFVSSFLYLRDKEILKKIYLALGCTLVGFLPMLTIIIKQFLISSKGTWVLPPENSEYMNQLQLFFNSKIIFNMIIWFICIGAGYYIVRKRSFKITKETGVVFLWWFLPFTSMFFISKTIPMFVNRYILFNTIGLYVFVGILLHTFYKKWMYYALSGIVVVALFIQLEINAKDFYYREVKNAVNQVKKFENPNSAILVYPHWADLGFMYYYNLQVFQTVPQYESLLNQKHIYNVWDKNGVISKMEELKTKRVLVYQDGYSDDNSIFKLLDSTHIRLDSTFYPQCFYVGVYEPRK